MENLHIHKLRSQSTPIYPSGINTKHRISKNEQSFSTHLKAASNRNANLTISKHAEMRMDQRKINIEPDVWEEIGDKLNEAKQKGVNDSLVLLENAALIVSAKNNTVVTVMDRCEAGSQIFTNIDGTIVLD